jgi:hypothetical protein
MIFLIILLPQQNDKISFCHFSRLPLLCFRISLVVFLSWYFGYTSIPCLNNLLKSLTLRYFLGEKPQLKMKEKEKKRLYKKEVRFNKAEKDFIDSIVEKSGSNFSAYTRHLYYKNDASAAAPRLKIDLGDLEAKRYFYNLCNNFNQMVKHMHQTGSSIPDVGDELEKILKAVRDGYSKSM